MLEKKSFISKLFKLAEHTVELIHSKGRFNLSEEALKALYQGREPEKALQKILEHIEIGCDIATESDRTLKVTAAEKDKILHKLFADYHALMESSQPVVLDDDRLFHKKFEKCAEKNPSHPAIICEQGSLTYQEVKKESDQLAYSLILLKRKKNWPSGTPIILFFENSREAVISILAIMKAGLAYVPLTIDHKFNEQQLNYIVRASKAKLLLVQDKLQAQYHHYSIMQNNNSDKKIKIRTYSKLQVDSDLEKCKAEIDSVAIKDNQLAYIIFSSGSTGSPKGIRIGHRGITIPLEAVRKYLQITPSDCVALHSSLGFDASLLDIMQALGTGATLVIIPPVNRMSKQALESYLHKQNVTLITLIPSLLELLTPEALPKLRGYISTGEPGLEHLFKNWHKKGRGKKPRIGINGYGPSEATIAAMLGIYKPDCAINIGTVIDGLDAFVLELPTKENPHPFAPKAVAEGQEGELYLAGPGLALGYLGAASYDQKFRYIPHPKPTEDEQVLEVYQTGDMVRFKNGKYYYLERIDGLLKFFGEQVSPEQIIHALRSFKISGKSIISDARVILYSEENPKFYRDKCLLVYVKTVDNQATLTPKIINQIQFFLQNHSLCRNLPSRYIQLQEWQLTQNGKIDVKNLNRENSHILYPGCLIRIMPKEKTEKDLAQIWYEVLAIDPKTYEIALDDRFDDLGGTSLHVEAMLSLVTIKCDLNSPTYDRFMSAMTLRTLAWEVTKSQGKQRLTWIKGREVFLSGRYDEAKPSCPTLLVHSVLGSTSDYQQLIKYWDPHLPLLAMESPSLQQPGYIATSIESLAADYLTTLLKMDEFQFYRGPLNFMGYSAGGTLAYEMAKQWQRSNFATVYCIDTPSPNYYQGLSQKDYAAELYGMLEELVVNVGMGLQAQAITTLEELAKYPKIKQLSFYWQKLQEYLFDRNYDHKQYHRCLGIYHSLCNLVQNYFNYETTALKLNTAKLLAFSESQTKKSDLCLRWNRSIIDLVTISNAAHRDFVHNPSLVKELVTKYIKPIHSESQLHFMTVQKNIACICKQSLHKSGPYWLLLPNISTHLEAIDKDSFDIEHYSQLIQKLIDILVLATSDDELFTAITNIFLALLNRNILLFFRNLLDVPTITNWYSVFIQKLMTNHKRLAMDIMASLRDTALTLHELKFNTQKLIELYFQHEFDSTTFSLDLLQQLTQYYEQKSQFSLASHFNCFAKSKMNLDFTVERTFLQNECILLINNLLRQEYNFLYKIYIEDPDFVNNKILISQNDMWCRDSIYNQICRIGDFFAAQKYSKENHEKVNRCCCRVLWLLQQNEETDSSLSKKYRGIIETKLKELSSKKTAGLDSANLVQWRQRWNIFASTILPYRIDPYLFTLDNLHKNCKMFNDQLDAFMAVLCQETEEQLGSPPCAFFSVVKPCEPDSGYDLFPEIKLSIIWQNVVSSITNESIIISYFRSFRDLLELKILSLCDNNTMPATWIEPNLMPHDHTGVLYLRLHKEIQIENSQASNLPVNLLNIKFLYGNEGLVSIYLDKIVQRRSANILQLIRNISFRSGQGLIDLPRNIITALSLVYNSPVDLRSNTILWQYCNTLIDSHKKIALLASDDFATLSLNKLLQSIIDIGLSWYLRSQQYQYSLSHNFSYYNWYAETEEQSCLDLLHSKIYPFLEGIFSQWQSVNNPIMVDSLFYLEGRMQRCATTERYLKELAPYCLLLGDNSILQFAARYWTLTDFCKLLDRASNRYNIDLRDANGDRAMEIAVVKRRNPMASHLLTKGAQPYELGSMEQFQKDFIATVNSSALRDSLKINHCVLRLFKESVKELREVASMNNYIFHLKQHQQTLNSNIKKMQLYIMQLNALMSPLSLPIRTLSSGIQEIAPFMVELLLYFIGTIPVILLLPLVALIGCYRSEKSEDKKFKTVVGIFSFATFLWVCCLAGVYFAFQQGMFTPNTTLLVWPLYFAILGIKFMIALPRLTKSNIIQRRQEIEHEVAMINDILTNEHFLVYRYATMTKITPHFIPPNIVGLQQRNHGIKISWTTADDFVIKSKSIKASDLDHALIFPDQLSEPKSVPNQGHRNIYQKVMDQIGHKGEQAFEVKVESREKLRKINQACERYIERSNNAVEVLTNRREQCQSFFGELNSRVRAKKELYKGLVTLLNSISYEPTRETYLLLKQFFTLIRTMPDFKDLTLTNPKVSLFFTESAPTSSFAVRPVSVLSYITPFV